MNESHALRRLLRFLWQFRLWLLISLLCAFISVLFSVIAPLLIGRIIDGITFVLIAFAAVSLVVSLIMICIFTYTSVLERT